MNSSWIDYLDLKRKNENEEVGIDLFALQFAYRDRILKNNIVYMFDEVGSGKTISAGIMMLEWLNNPQCTNKKALIITTPSQARGLYKADLESKFFTTINKFREEYGTEFFKVINNVYSNIEKEQDNEYGIIIVDEAQDFLINPNSTTDEKKRVSALKALKAEKVVFATATPVKYYKENLKEYAALGKCILSEARHLSDEEKDRQAEEEYKTLSKILSNEGKSETSIVASIFDSGLPVTRYFKDTIRSLQLGEKRKQKGKRQVEVWENNLEDTHGITDQLISKILEIRKKDKNSRYVVFVNRKDDARAIATKYQELSGEKAIAITSDNALDLKAISNNYDGFNLRDEELPVCVAITYQMAYAGVNLPRYNYIINYYIPGYTSDLEQFFGRVDRINTSYETVHMCYYLGGTRTSRKNFYSAFYQYIYSIVSDMPARNVILNEEVLDIIFKHQDDCKRLAEEDITYYESIKGTISKEVEEYLEKETTIEDDRLYEVAELLKKHIDKSISENKSLTLDELQKEYNDIVSGRIEHNRKLIDKLDKNNYSEDEKENYKKFIEEISDHIFYFTDPDTGFKSWDKVLANLKIVDPISCAEYISESDKYKRFIADFEKSIVVPVKIRDLHRKYDRALNRLFIEKYRNNELTEIFYIINKASFDRKALEEYLRDFWEELHEDEKFVSCFKEYNNNSGDETEKDFWRLKEFEAYEISDFFRGLEFFRVYCGQAKEQIEKACFDAKGLHYLNFPHNPIIHAYGSNECKELRNDIDGLLDEGSRVFEGGFFVKTIDGNKILTASPFYKLAFALFGVLKPNQFLDFLYSDLSTGSVRTYAYDFVFRYTEYKDIRYIDDLVTEKIINVLWLETSDTDKTRKAMDRLEIFNKKM